MFPHFCAIRYIEDDENRIMRINVNLFVAADGDGSSNAAAVTCDSAPVSVD